MIVEQFVNGRVDVVAKVRATVTHIARVENGQQVARGIGKVRTPGVGENVIIARPAKRQRNPLLEGHLLHFEFITKLPGCFLQGQGQAEGDRIFIGGDHLAIQLISHARFFK